MITKIVYAVKRVGMGVPINEVVRRYGVRGHKRHLGTLVTKRSRSCASRSASQAASSRVDIAELKSSSAKRDNIA